MRLLALFCFASLFAKEQPVVLGHGAARYTLDLGWAKADPAVAPIVNAPEVAILGVSKSSIQPVWDGKQFQPRLMLPLSLSYDHRVIDGAAAARFTAYLAQLLGDMRRVLL